MQSIAPNMVLLMVLATSVYAAGADDSEAKEALQTLFRREVPEHSKQLRMLWEKEKTLNSILKMDVVRDWAGLEPGMITVTNDCAEGSGALRVPVDIAPGEHLRKKTTSWPDITTASAT